MQELVRYARALLLLQLRQFEAAAQAGAVAPMRAEVILADAGFGAREIADLLGKNYAAVSKAISRARAGRPRERAEDSDVGGANDE